LFQWCINRRSDYGHVSLSQTNGVASVRFAFFFVQIIGFFWLMVVMVTGQAGVLR
jgi:hypothetical protein